MINDVIDFLQFAGLIIFCVAIVLFLLAQLLKLFPEEPEDRETRKVLTGIKQLSSSVDRYGDVTVTALLQDDSIWKKEDVEDEEWIRIN